MSSAPSTHFTPASTITSGGQTTANSTDNTAPATQGSQAPRFKEEDIPFTMYGIDFLLRFSAHIDLKDPFQELMITMGTATGKATSDSGLQDALYFVSKFDGEKKYMTNELHNLEVSKHGLFRVKPDGEDGLVPESKFRGYLGADYRPKEAIATKMHFALVALENLWKPEFCPSSWCIDQDLATEAVKYSCEVAKEFWQALNAQQARGVAGEK